MFTTFTPQIFRRYMTTGQYPKFDSYSATTKRELLAFCEEVASLIEMYGNESHEFTIRDYGKGVFNLQQMKARMDRFNEQFSGNIISIDFSQPSGWGPPNNRRLTVDTTFSYKHGALEKMKHFLLSATESVSTVNAPAKGFSADSITAGNLSYADGKITFKGKILKMRPQMKALCLFFMQNQGKAVDYSDIKEKIISAKKRSTIGNKTIVKYVGELQTLLTKCFRKKVLFNHEREGYIFEVK